MKIFKCDECGLEMDGSFFPNLMLTGAVIDQVEAHFPRKMCRKHFHSVNCIEAYLKRHRAIITEHLIDYGSKD
jgi:hypothetical protein